MLLLSSCEYLQRSSLRGRYYLSTYVPTKRRASPHHHRLEQHAGGGAAAAVRRRKPREGRPRVGGYAEEFIAKLEASRADKIPKKAWDAPKQVAVLIERLPLVNIPFKSWELDMFTVQTRIRNEKEQNTKLENTIPYSCGTSVPWAWDVFNDIFRSHANELGKEFRPLSAEELEKIKKEKEAAAEKLALEARLNAEAKKKAGGKKSPGKTPSPPQQQSSTSTAQVPAESKKQDNKKQQGQQIPGEDADDDSENSLRMTAKQLEETQRKRHEDLDNLMKLAFQTNDGEESEAERLRREQESMFKPSPRVTAADIANDTRTMNRKLWNKLYLVVKRNGVWGLPRVTRGAKTDEPMLADVERAAGTLFNLGTEGEDIPQARFDQVPDLHFLSACPTLYRYNGSHIEFWYRAQILEGEFKFEQAPVPVEDFQWLTPREIAKLLSGGDEDEEKYLLHSFADTYWDVPDDDRSSPVEDETARKPATSISRAIEKKRESERAEREGSKN